MIACNGVIATTQSASFPRAFTLTARNYYLLSRHPFRAFVSADAFARNFTTTTITRANSSPHYSISASFSLHATLRKASSAVTRRTPVARQAVDISVSYRGLICNTELPSRALDGCPIERTDSLKLPYHTVMATPCNHNWLCNSGITVAPSKLRLKPSLWKIPGAVYATAEC